MQPLRNRGFGVSMLNVLDHWQDHAMLSAARRAVGPLDHGKVVKRFEPELLSLHPVYV